MLTWLLIIALGVSTGADIASTDACQRRGCIETASPALLTRHPSPVRAALGLGGISAAEAGGLLATRRHGPRWIRWAVRGLVVAEVVGHGYYAARNGGVCPHGRDGVCRP